MSNHLHRAASSAALLAALLAPDLALANFAISPTGASTLFAVDSSNTSATGSGGCASVECAANVPIDVTGAPLGVAANPFGVKLNTTPSLANGSGVVPTQGGAVLSATNGAYSNLLQGNVALSATNGLYSNLLQGNAVISATNGLFANVLQGNAVLSASNPSFASIVQGGAAATVGTYGTAPGAVGALNVNAFITNTNANGAAAPSSSSPVVASTFSHASTTALGTSLVAKASAGNLAAFNCTGVAGAAAGYCIAYNGTSAPATGALTGSLVLDYCYFDTTAKGCSLSHIPNSIAFSTGIVVLMTSAANPYTYTTGVLTGAIEADYF